MTRNISILGSTGSIGTQALDVSRERGFNVKALAANSNVKLLEQQIRKFKPLVAAVFSEEKAAELKIAVKDTPTKVLSGEDGILEAASLEDSDTVLNAIVGIAGLKSTLAAINSGKTLALANKESLVTGGEIVMKTAAEKNVKILPVDSEHSAIFQSMQGIVGNPIEKIILTASGGPFFSKTREELAEVTVEQTLKHPNWDMGAKITVDSATLMNKGLEVIEAMHLFSVPVDKIEIVVHRESIIHSGIELCDGAVIAQLGAPDMKLPIQYALTYPERFSCPAKRLNLFEVGQMTFFKPDMDTFRCLKVCLLAAKQGGLKPTAANGANEEAVRLFLDKKIKFLDIGDLVAAATENQPCVESFTVEDVFEADKAAREFVRSHIFKR